MTLPNPSAGDSIAAAHIASIKNHLEGTASYTAPYHLRQSSGSMVITLPDNAGATKFRVNDSDDAEIFSVDSNGNISQAGTFSPSTLMLPNSAAPAVTADGSAAWDSDDNNIAVGDGTNTLKFFPNGKGSDIASTGTVTLAGEEFFHITGTTTITGITARPAGVQVLLYFESALTLTHGASFLLRGSSSRVTRAAEFIRFVSEGSGTWREAAIGYPAPLTLLSSSIANNTTTLATALSYPMAASATYMVRGLVIYMSGTTPDMKYGLLGPASSSGTIIYSGVVTASWSTTVVNDTDLTSVSTFAVDGAGATTQSISRFEAMVTTGATAGNLSLQFAQNTANASDTTLVAGTTMDVVRVL